MLQNGKYILDHKGPQSQALVFPEQYFMISYYAQGTAKYSEGCRRYLSSRGEESTHISGKVTV